MELHDLTHRHIRIERDGVRIHICNPRFRREPASIEVILGDSVYRLDSVEQLTEFVLGVETATQHYEYARILHSMGAKFVGFGAS